MKFTVTRDVLLKPLQVVSGAVEKRQTLPILANVLVQVDDNKLLLSATDTEIELVAKIDLEEQAEVCGESTLPAKKLIDICRSLPVDVHMNFHFDESRCLVKAAKSKFSLAVLSAEDYPKLEEEAGNTEFSIGKSDFEHLLSATYFSMAQQDVRYYLNGLLLHLSGKLITSVSTDGHRLAWCQLPCSAEFEDTQVILPRKGVHELMRLLAAIEDETIEVIIGKNHIQVYTSCFNFVSKLIVGRFPNYRQVLPRAQDKCVIVDRDILKQSLSRVAILSNEKSRGIRLHIQACQLKVMAINQEQEQAEEELEVSTEGEGLEIGLNVGYLLDVLNNVPSGDVKLSLSNPNASVLIASLLDQTTQYVIMPMKL